MKLVHFLKSHVQFTVFLVLALLIGETVRSKSFFRTVAYLPNMLPGLAVVILWSAFFSGEKSGVLNILPSHLGIAPQTYLTRSEWVIPIIILIATWKGAGATALIYMAGMSSVSPELYEAAEVDGASRLRKIWHITLPGIRSTIIILLIMNLGRILGSEFDRPFTLSNPLVEGASKTISIFVYERGIKGNQFALSTAVGLFQSVVCVIFLLASNTLAKKFDEPGIM